MTIYVAEVKAEPIPEAYGLAGYCFKCTKCGLTPFLLDAPQTQYVECDYCGAPHEVRE